MINEGMVEGVIDYKGYLRGIEGYLSASSVITTMPEYNTIGLAVQ